MVVVYLLQYAFREARVFDIGIGAAFLAGLLSFVSPCVLPIVPPYLAYLAGVSFSELRDDDQRTETASRRIPVSYTHLRAHET